ncbi:MAG: cupin [Lachnospiraceae bacterium]|nr:cupin [Lachnospiraceae bacterium]
MNTFERFNNGKLVLSNAEKNFCNVEWSKHPTFEGVELKHILTASDTGGVFSYHLVKIAPNCSIKEHMHEKQLETHEVIMGMGECINGGTSICYEPGVISIMTAGVFHEVNALSEGLYLFAKFIPALC